MTNQGENYKWIILIFGLLAMTATASEIYKCTDANGKVTFSQRKCAENAETVNVDNQPTGVVLDAQGDWSKVEQGNQRSIARAIDRAQDRLRELMNTRDNKLAELRRKQSYANKNLAGAQYRQSLAEEMAAVSSDYKARIQA